MRDLSYIKVLRKNKGPNKIIVSAVANAVISERLILSEMTMKWLSTIT
jgi:hypothetical protein